MLYSQWGHISTHVYNLIWTKPPIKSSDVFYLTCFGKKHELSTHQHKHIFHISTGGEQNTWISQQTKGFNVDLKLHIPAVNNPNATNSIWIYLKVQYVKYTCSVHVS